jgi:hypothetical protein
MGQAERAWLFRFAERLSGAICTPGLWVVVVVLGLSARCYQYFGNPSYWYDEAFLVRGVIDLSFSELIGPLPARTIVPPVFLWLLRLCYITFGAQEWSLRLPAFIASIGALALMIPLARRWLGSPGWMWAVGFCALSTHCIHHAFEVRPYATDFLATTILLWLAQVFLAACDTTSRRQAGAGLLTTSAVVPWLSFPAIFVLFAVCVTLFIHYLKKRDGRRLAFWFCYSSVFLLSSFIVWYIQARHLYYPGLKNEWTYVWGGFPKDYSAQTLMLWTALTPERVAHYASTGLGIPLVILGLAGLIRCWRRSMEEISLLFGPPVFAYAAALLGKYPLADRTLLFLAPVVWLVAAEGLLYLMERGYRAKVVVPILAFGLMIPGMAISVQHCIRVRPRMEYREALTYVLERRGENEAVWNWCPDLNYVYVEHIFLDCPSKYASDPVEPLGAARAANKGPLWVIAPNNQVENMTESLRSLPLQRSLCHQFFDVQVLRFDPRP